MSPRCRKWRPHLPPSTWWPPYSVRRQTACLSTSPARRLPPTTCLTSTFPQPCTLPTYKRTGSVLVRLLPPWAVRTGTREWRQVPDFFGLSGTTEKGETSGPCLTDPQLLRHDSVSTSHGCLFVIPLAFRPHLRPAQQAHVHASEGCEPFRQFRRDDRAVRHHARRMSSELLQSE